MPGRDLAETPVVILNWNGWDNTLECLRSLVQASDVRVVWLVDNGSDIDRGDEALAVWPRLRLVSLDRNFGFSGGMNRAMRIAAAEGYPFAYLLNNDATVVPGFLSATLEAARDSDIAIVGSRIGYAVASNWLCFDGQYYKQGERVIDDSSCIRQVSVVNGAGMLVRLAAVERGGYFDERFFCYHEEVELCERLIAAGWSCAMADASLILHKRKGSDINDNALYYGVRNRFLLADGGHGVAGIRRRLDACYNAAVAGDLARKTERRDQWSTVAAALSDGLRRRFGQRRVSHDATAGTVVLRVLLVLLRVTRWLSVPFRWRDGALQADEPTGGPPPSPDKIRSET